MNKVLEQILEAVGSQAALARMLGVRQSNVWNWINRENSRGIPPQFVIKIEMETGIPRHEIRPDVFPDEKNA